MGDEVNVTVSEETPIQITVADRDVVAVSLAFYNGGMLRFNTETLSADGVETSFPFEHSFIPGSLMIFKNGVLATDEYTPKADMSGVDFSEAPLSDDNYEARYAYV